MSRDTRQALINLLRRSDGWVEASILAEHFSVSSRTIRNYVSSINETETPPVILSSHKGYHYNPEHINAKSRTEKRTETQESRVSYLLRRVITSEKSLDVFDLAEELFVSNVTLERDISRVRKIMEPFGVYIHREKDKFILTGSERQKRQLIYHLISDGNDTIIPTDQAGLLVDENIYIELNAYIPRLFEEHEVYVGGYGLANIINHLKITIERVSNGQSVTGKVPIEKICNSKEYELAQLIQCFVYENYGVDLSEEEQYYMSLNISSNSNLLKYKLINPSNIHQYVEENCISLAKATLKRLESAFFLDPFDDAFFVKFTIHIHNLIQRAKSNLKIVNPLVLKMKMLHPLIYTMAVFISNDIRKIENIVVSEDEVAFIAFHIGTYLEESKISKDRVNAIFVYTDYHNMHQPVLTKIQQNFEQELNVVAAVPLNELDNQTVAIDMIITTADSQFESVVPILKINIFLTSHDIRVMHHKINEIYRQKKAIKIRRNIQSLAVSTLFKQNYYAEDEFHMIRKLTEECYRMGYCNENFQKDVLAREEVSSTSFPNFVAIPHSIQPNTKRSFLSIVVNEKPMKWGKYPVQIIILIGICRDDLTIFQDVFDDMVAVLSDATYTKKLAKCTSYESFLEKLSEFVLDLRQ